MPFTGFPLLIWTAILDEISTHVTSRTKAYSAKSISTFLNWTDTTALRTQHTVALATLDERSFLIANG